MSPRRGQASSARKLAVLGLGLLTGLGCSVMVQACWTSDCSNVEALPLLGGAFERTDAWGEIAPHAKDDEVLVRLEVREHMLTAELDTPGGHIVEVWELGRLETW